MLPWEIHQLPEEWMWGFRTLIDELPEMRKGYQQLDDAFERTKARFARKQ